MIYTVFKDHKFSDDNVDRYLQQAQESTLTCMNDEFHHGIHEGTPEVLNFGNPFFESVPNGLQLIRVKVTCKICGFYYWEKYTLSGITMKKPIRIQHKGSINHDGT